MNYRGVHRPETVGLERVNRWCFHPSRAWWQLPGVLVRCGWCRTIVPDSRLSEQIAIEELLGGGRQPAATPLVDALAYADRNPVPSVLAPLCPDPGGGASSCPEL